MKKRPDLSRSMSITEFENGYWYATDIKEFAASLGIPHGNKLRKDELEKSIKLFLTTGKIALPSKRELIKSGIKDTEKGLSLKLLIVHYTNNKETKDFIVREAKRISAQFKERSGARYRLNRWREEQLTIGIRLTYGDLIKYYVQLNKDPNPFKKIPVGRYINFLAEYLSSEKNATRTKAIAAWKKLKNLNCEKKYRAWKKEMAGQ